MSLDLPVRVEPAAGRGPFSGAYPVRTGLPFPKGAVREGTRLALLDPRGQAVLFDLEPLARWKDGSWKWAALAFVARADGAAEATYRLVESPTPARGLVPPLKASDGFDRVTVDTGAARFLLAKASPWPFLRVEAAGRTLAGSELRPEGPGLALHDASGRPARFRADSFRAESPGAAARTFAWDGSLAGAGGETCRLRVRLTLWAGTALAKAEFTLWNPRPARHAGGLWDLGDPGSAFFRGLTLSLPFPPAEAPAEAPSEAAAEGFRLALGLAGPEADLLPCGAAAALRQESSGNPDWKSLVHVDRTGTIVPRWRGYRFRNAAHEAAGDHANPVLLRSAGGRLCALALEDFWQAFPKGIRTEGDTAVLEPFPPREDGRARSADTPGAGEGGDGLFELQGGEKAGFTAWLDFDADAERPHLALLAARHPAAVSLPPAWHARTGAWGHLPASPRAGDPLFEGMARAAIEGPDDFFRRRDRFEEYGWRNFGEVAADHEIRHYGGSREFVSHYNNQYDLVLSFLSRHAVTGDPRWHALGRDLARHVVHHDLYHTRGDKPAYNGGYFWHTAHYLHAGTATHRTYSRLAKDDGSLPPGFGGGPSNEHNYPTGLLHWHFLTGDPEAREAVLMLARWVRDMQDGNLSVFRFASRNPTGLATATRDPAYQGPGRGAAFSINACLDAFALSGEREWLSLAEGFIATCIHPADDQKALDLLNREERWSYVVFLQVLGKYLDAKLELEETRDEPFRLARASLLAYAAWMAVHEYPYLDRPGELEYPTSTWAGQELRKVCAFLWAARYAPPGEARRYREKAEAFFLRARDQLAAADDRDSVRNLALVLGQAPLYQAALEQGSAWELGLPRQEGAFPPKRTFTPQKAQAKRNVKMMAATLGLAGAARLLMWLARGRR